MRVADVLVIGGGVDGPTLALALHARGVLEAAAEVRPLGVGLNVLPHASAELAALGLQDALSRNGMLAITGGCKRLAGYDLKTLRARNG